MSDLFPAFPRAAEDAVGHFTPLIRAIAAIAAGDTARQAEVESLLPELDNNGWQIGDAARRIWAGERDAEALAAGLDANSAAVVRAMAEAARG
ncbi:MAG TPA: hypothetical protein VGE07_25495 [Herpetosiphonaceae bacterium]